MQPMEMVRQFLSSQNSVTFGEAEIKFFSFDELESAQVGFVRDADGTYFFEEELGDRCHGWYAIGTDMIGDQVAVDLAKEGLPVITVEPGEAFYNKLADSIDHFREILEKLREVAAGREDPERFKAKPLSFREKSRALRFMQKRNGGEEYDYWNFFFDCAKGEE